MRAAPHGPSDGDGDEARVAASVGVVLLESTPDEP